MIRSYLSKFISLNALMPFMIIMVFVVVVLRLVASKTPGFKRRQKKFYYYLLINLVIMAIFATIVYNLKQSTLMFRYFSLLVFALIMGGLHVFFYRNTFDKFDTQNKFKELLFALIASFAIIVPIIMIATHFNDLQYLYYYFLVTLAFVLPTSFFVLFNYSVSIPVKLFSKWYYPLGKKYDTPKHYELQNMIVLNFMFYKNPKAESMTSFKAKAPKDMGFGKLFFFFINDYNDKKSTTKIEMTEDSGDPFGWYFYSKPQWYGASKHIDSEITVEENNLADGDVVVCQRI